MTDNFKTYVFTNPSQVSKSFTLGPTGLTGYDGFLYLIMGPGGNGGVTLDGYTYGGPSGFMNSGYIDLNHPYTVEYVTVTLDSNSGTSLYIDYTNPNIDPTLGNSPLKLTADVGKAYLLDNAAPVVQKNYVAGFYAPANNFPGVNGGNPQLLNQRGEEVVNVIQAEGAVTDDFGQGDNSSIFAGGGFYGGSRGPTGPFGFGSGNYWNGPGIGTLGYAIITLIPKTSVDNTYFFTGGTGAVGPGFYLYSLLGGGGGGGNLGGIFGPGGGGGSGDIRNGFIEIGSSTLLNYEVGEGGLVGESGGDTYISTDSIQLSAIAGQTPGFFEGGIGFFAGGFNGPAEFVQEGQTYTNIPSNFTKNANGAGFVNSNYGQGGGSDPSSNSFGGGGGPYGGGYGSGGINGLGYGCGGAGGGGNGSSGYVILKSLMNNNFKYLNITSSTLVSPADFFEFTGVWGFMDAPDTEFVPVAPPGRSYFNTFHFLIKEDNVQEISVTKDINNYFTTIISFSQLNNKTQKFTMTGLQPSPYMSLFFYR